MINIDQRIRDFSKTLWAYNNLEQKLTPKDFIFVMCSYNLSVADRAFELFQQKMGKFIVLSGGIAHQNDLLNTGWDQAEAIVFQKRLRELGMKDQDIYIEDQTQNCGENVIYSKALLEQKNIKVSSGVIVQKPYMERRAIATAEQQWTDITWQVTSPNISYDEYIVPHDEERLIHILVGDTQRIINYADKGFQTVQHMPENVLYALNTLKEHGFSKHL